MKEYFVDLESFSVEAENEQEAYSKAQEVIKEGVKICNIEEN